MVKPIMATVDVRCADDVAAPRLIDGLARRGMAAVLALDVRVEHANRREMAHGPLETCEGF